MKLKYNSPVILTFAFLCAGILFVSGLTGGTLIASFFRVPGRGEGFSFLSLGVYKLVSHALGHADWPHLVGNFSIILLIGPILEEKYGSADILFMMIVTAAVTGIINVLFFPTGLLGASGVAFMLILLISFTNLREGEIPLTFIFIVLLYLGNEIWAMIANHDNISRIAHIAGGICGGIFGFLLSRGGKKTEAEITDGRIQ